MSYTEHYIKEQLFLLNSKGYNEESLCNPDKPGTFSNKITEGIYKIVNEGLREKEKTDFEVEVDGFFNKNRQIIHFALTFSFDPNSCDLRITDMKLRSGPDIQKFPITKPDDIKRPEELVNYFKEISLPRKKYCSGLERIKPISKQTFRR